MHKIRKLISGEIRTIFAQIALARQKLAQAKETGDAEQRDLLTQEAQRLFIDAETCANALRNRYRQNPDMNLDFMPAYLRNFLTAGVSAQTMFDRGRLEAVQARAEQLAFEERRREEKIERRRKLAGEEEVDDEDNDFSDGGVPVLAVEEKLVLKDVLGDVKQLNVLLQRVQDKMAVATETDERDAMAAADNAMEAANLLESAMQMQRAVKRKLKNVKAKRLRPILPLHLLNVLTMTLPLLEMWRGGHTEAAVCDAILVYIYVCIYIYIYVYIYICVRISYMYIYICVYMYIYVYVYMCESSYECAYDDDTAARDWTERHIEAPVCDAPKVYIYKYVYTYAYIYI